MNTVELSELYTAKNYDRYPVAFVRGRGRRLWDENGRSYLDLFSGLGVSSLGHGHAGLGAALAEQTSLLLHSSNLYHQGPGARLAQALAEGSFADRVFFCNSGTEAVEAAVRMARRRDPDRHEIVTALGGFHGRTLGSLAATGQSALHEGAGPMPEGFIHVPYDDPAALGDVLGTHTAAVMVEPILGEGGVVVPAEGYLEQLRAACDHTGALLIFDEVQTGAGRTGSLWAYQQTEAIPDILTCAKGLAAGLPIGAVLATEAATAGFTKGSYGSTFGANPLACRAALAVLEALENEGVLENCRRSGAHLGQRLEALAAARNDIVEVRGRGLMMGMELTRAARPVVEAALEAGVVVNATAHSVVRFLPPLTVTTTEIDEGLEVVERCLNET